MVILNQNYINYSKDCNGQCSNNCSYTNEVYPLHIQGGIYLSVEKSMLFSRQNTLQILQFVILHR